MNIPELEKKSRKMSKLLRHDPDTLKMDGKGWVSSDELITYLRITMDGLQWIVDNNDKKRFVFNEDKTLIRASQGHSNGIGEDKEYVRITALQAEMPLYHGTDDATASLIKDDKIISGKRQFVHWSADIDVAKKRAKQRSFHNKTKPVLVVLNARSYIHGGGKLLMAENAVYLTPEIDGKILRYEEF